MVRYAFGQQQGGRAYRASLVSKDSAAAVAGKVRDGLKAAGWQITQDQPQGFATQLQIAHTGQGLVGQVVAPEERSDPLEEGGLLDRAGGGQEAVDGPFHAIRERLDGRRLEIPGRKRLDIDHGSVIREIIA